MKWFMKFFGRDDKQITIGSRVSYQGYEGTVIHGVLAVKFDKKPSFMKSSGKKDVTTCFNLAKNNLEIL